MPKGDNPRFKDLTGQRFGRLTVQHIVASPNPKITRKFWRCVCDCGNTKDLPSHRLVQGAAKSCGCLLKESPGRAPGKKDKVSFRPNRIPPQSIQARLPDYLTIDLSTYVTGNKEARFIDAEYGEFYAVVNSVIGGLVKHPTRGKANLGLNRKRSIDVRGISEAWGIPYSTICFVARTYGDEFAEEYAKTRQDYVSSLEKFVIDKFGYERFNKTLIHKYRPDFRLSPTVYLNSDGPMYHSEIFKENNYHFLMRRRYEAAGVTLLQFYAHELVSSTEIVKSIVDAKLGKLGRAVYARKTSVMKLTHAQARPFVESAHLMGWASATYYGLVTKDNKIVSVIGVRQKNNAVDVTRFCNALNTNVVGGLSKLISHVKKVYNPEVITSWVDLRYGTGASLERIGFKAVKDVQSWRWTDGFSTHNRLSCRANMDERGLSEAEYAKEKRWVKIYDAGQRQFELKS